MQLHEREHIEMILKNFLKNLFKRVFTPPANDVGCSVDYPMEKVCLFFADYERRNEVTEWTYCGMEVWPVIRVHLVDTLELERRLPVCKIQILRVIYFLFRICYSCGKFFHSRRSTGTEISALPALSRGEPIEKADIICCSSSSPNPDGSLPRLGLSLKPFIHAGYSCVLMQCTQPPTKAVQTDGTYRYEALPMDICRHDPSEGLPEWYGKYIKLYLDLGYVPPFLLDELASMKSYADMSCEQFQKWGVKLVIGTGICHAVNIACKRLGIPAVEIQHGFAGHFHPFYGFWEAIPKGGYQLLPTVFWKWSDFLCQEMCQACPALVPYAEFINGGCWHQLTAYPEPPHSDPDLYRDFLQERKKWKKVIAVCFGRLFEQQLQTMIRLSQECPHDYLWLIRFHPNQRDRQEKMDYITEKLHLDNVECRFANALSVQEIVKDTDVILSDHSTTAQEASVYGTTTIFMTTTRARFYYKEALEAGVMLYCEREENFRDLLEKAFSIPREKVADFSRYYFSDRKTALHNLRLFLEKHKIYPSSGNLAHFEDF